MSLHPTVCAYKEKVECAASAQAGRRTAQVYGRRRCWEVERIELEHVYCDGEMVAGESKR